MRFLGSLHELSLGSYLSCGNSLSFHQGDLCLSYCVIDQCNTSIAFSCKGIEYNSSLV